MFDPKHFNYRVIPSEVVSVIESMDVDGNALLPTYEIKDKKLWSKMAGILKNNFLGAWSANKQGFEFPCCASEVQYIATHYGMPPRNLFDRFDSPESVQNGVALQLEYNSNKFHQEKSVMVFEPNYGGGNLVKQIKSSFPESCNVIVEACEIDPLARACALNKEDDVTFVGDDLLEFDAKARYDIIPMNPPFNTKGRPQAWFDHLQHVLPMLKSTGKLACVFPSKWCTQTKSFNELKPRFKEIYEFIAMLPGIEIEPNEKKAFHSEGTDEETATLAVFNSRYVMKKDYAFSSLELRFNNSNSAKIRQLAEGYYEGSYRLDEEHAPFVKDHLLTECLNEMHFIPEKLVDEFLATICASTVKENETFDLFELDQAA